MRWGASNGPPLPPGVRRVPGIPGRASTPPADFAFDVFISYSRKDAVFARRLEQALRAYAPPRDLPVPQRTLRVFRDESDFVGTEYAGAVRRKVAALVHPPPAAPAAVPAAAGPAAITRPPAACHSKRT